MTGVQTCALPIFQPRSESALQIADSCAYSRVMSDLGMGGLLGGGDVDLAGHGRGDDGGAALGE